jgi:hypothetical protein
MRHRYAPEAHSGLEPLRELLAFGVGDAQRGQCRYERAHGRRETVRGDDRHGLTRVETKATGKELWRCDHHAGQLDPKSAAAVLDAATDEIGAFHLPVQKSRRSVRDTEDRADLEAKVKQEEARLAATVRQLPGAGIGGYGFGGIYLIVMTPCSDGRQVVAVFPTGLAVAYDQEGKWLWSTRVRPPTTRPKDYGKGRWRPVPGVLSACPVFTREGIVGRGQSHRRRPPARRGGLVVKPGDHGASGQELLRMEVPNPAPQRLD